jgi:hypothetical protein
LVEFSLQEDDKKMILHRHPTNTSQYLHFAVLSLFSFIIRAASSPISRGPGFAGAVCSRKKKKKKNI